MSKKALQQRLNELHTELAAATELDPGCAMAWWGIAYANGPHINNPAVDEAHAKAAWAALQKARESAPQASPVERDLIEALSHRYADPQPDDRAPLDAAFADAMRKVHEAWPGDADVQAIYDASCATTAACAWKCSACAMAEEESFCPNYGATKRLSKLIATSRDTRTTGRSRWSDPNA